VSALLSLSTLEGILVVAVAGVVGWLVARALRGKKH
jgi:hypothetical protein